MASHKSKSKTNDKATKKKQAKRKSRSIKKVESSVNPRHAKHVTLKKGVLSVKNVCKNIAKEKVKRKTYSKESLASAIAAVNYGISLRKAANNFGVPFSTLSRKINNPDKIDAKSGPSTVLSQDQEGKIVNWMIHRAKIGSPVDKDELLDSVQSYLNSERKETVLSNNRPGRRWYENFIKRYPNVSLRKAQNLTAIRANVTEEDLRDWFKEIELYLNEHDLMKLPPGCIFNCDETSVQLCPSTKRVFAEKGVKAVYNVVGGSDKECLTVLFMFSADGKRAPPMIMYKGKTSIAANILQRAPKDWGLGVSENGWMTAETFHEYITLVFYPWLLSEHIEFPILLYMDGHSSHCRCH